MRWYLVWANVGLGRSSGVHVRGRPPAWLAVKAQLLVSTAHNTHRGYRPSLLPDDIDPIFNVTGRTRFARTTSTVLGGHRGSAALADSSAPGVAGTGSMAKGGAAQVRSGRGSPPRRRGETARGCCFSRGRLQPQTAAHRPFAHSQPPRQPSFQPKRTRRALGARHGSLATPTSDGASCTRRPALRPQADTEECLDLVLHTVDTVFMTQVGHLKDWCSGASVARISVPNLVGTALAANRRVGTARGPGGALTTNDQALASLAK